MSEEREVNGANEVNEVNELNRVRDVPELVDMEITSQGTIIEVLRIVDPKDVFEPVKTRLVEWLDEATFRSTEIPGDPSASLASVDSVDSVDPLA